MNKVNINLHCHYLFLKRAIVLLYSPALDLSTVGDTFKEAQNRFEEAVEIFFEEISEKGTVEEALTELGWQKVKKQLVPPQVVSNQTKQFSLPSL